MARLLIFLTIVALTTAVPFRLKWNQRTKPWTSSPQAAAGFRTLSTSQYLDHLNNLCPASDSALGETTHPVSCVCGLSNLGTIEGPFTRFTQMKRCEPQSCQCADGSVVTEELSLADIRSKLQAADTNERLGEGSSYRQNGEKFIAAICKEGEISECTCKRDGETTNQVAGTIRLIRGCNPTSCKCDSAGELTTVDIGADVLGGEVANIDKICPGDEAPSSCACTTNFPDMTRGFDNAAFFAVRCASKSCTCADGSTVELELPKFLQETAEDAAVVDAAGLRTGTTEPSPSEGQNGDVGNDDDEDEEEKDEDKDEEEQDDDDDDEDEDEEDEDEEEKDEDKDEEEKDEDKDDEDSVERDQAKEKTVEEKEEVKEVKETDETVERNSEETSKVLARLADSCDGKMPESVICDAGFELSAEELVDPTTVLLKCRPVSLKCDADSESVPLTAFGCQKGGIPTCPGNFPPACPGGSYFLQVEEIMEAEAADKCVCEDLQAPVCLDERDDTVSNLLCPDGSRPNPWVGNPPAYLAKCKLGR